MNHYQQSLVLEAKPAAVFAALTTAAGLRGWWTRDCDVATAVGGTIQFRFDPHYKNMRIEELESGRKVRWLCTAAQICAPGLTRRDEWVGTEVVFRLLPAEDGRTLLEFEHIGLVPQFECFAMCSRGWRHFMASLQQFVETGRGTPYESTEAAAA